MAGIWTQHFDAESGHRFWHNMKSGLSTWEEPGSTATAASVGGAGSSGNGQNQMSVGQRQAAEAAEKAAAAATSAAERCVSLRNAMLLQHTCTHFVGDVFTD